VHLGARHFSRAARADIDLNQNRIRTPNEMTDAAPRREKAPRKGVEPGAIRFRRTLTARRETHLPLDKLAGRRASYRLYFLAERRELPAASGILRHLLRLDLLGGEPA
jgi:hypothetical protein